MSGLAASACVTGDMSRLPRGGGGGGVAGTKRARFEESDDIPLSVGKYSAVGEAERAYRGTVQAVYFPPAIASAQKTTTTTTKCAGSSTPVSTSNHKPRKPIPLKSAPKDIEQGFLDQGYEYVIGVDETGVGSLSGPICVCATIVPIEVTIGGVRDSKKFDGPSLIKRRDEIYELLQADKRVRKVLVFMDHKYVDAHNPLQARLDGMTRAVDELLDACEIPRDTPIKVIIDGDKAPKSLTDRYDCMLLPGADAKCYCVGACSILAKVARDRYMSQVLHPLFPEYKWDENHGYPRPEHMAKVQSTGYTPFHRISFNPCNKVQMSEHGKAWLAAGHHVEDYASPD